MSAIITKLFPTYTPTTHRAFNSAWKRGQRAPGIHGYCTSPSYAYGLRHLSSFHPSCQPQGKKETHVLSPQQLTSHPNHHSVLTHKLRILFQRELKENFISWSDGFYTQNFKSKTRSLLLHLPLPPCFLLINTPHILWFIAVLQILRIAHRKCHTAPVRKSKRWLLFQIKRNLYLRYGERFSLKNGSHVVPNQGKRCTAPQRGMFLVLFLKIVTEHELLWKSSR